MLEFLRVEHFSTSCACMRHWVLCTFVTLCHVIYDFQPRHIRIPTFQQSNSLWICAYFHSIKYILSTFLCWNVYSFATNCWMSLFPNYGAECMGNCSEFDKIQRAHIYLYPRIGFFLSSNKKRLLKKETVPNRINVNCLCIHNLSDKGKYHVLHKSFNGDFVCQSNHNLDIQLNDAEKAGSGLINFYYCGWFNK